jgi:iron-sulfur cluster assembly protein
MAAPSFPITVTPAAIDRVRFLLAQRETPPYGLKIGVQARGCSGMSYTLEYVDQRAPMDEEVETQGVKILIDPKATMFLFGTEMDFIEDRMSSGFVFRNPNEKGRCGCGESFHV